MTKRPIDRLLEYLDFIGVKPYLFEKENGISNGYLNNQKIKKGQIGSEILDKIHNNHSELNLTWIITGEGKMIMPKKGNIPPLNDTILNESGIQGAIPPPLKGHHVSENVSPTVSPTLKSRAKSVEYSTQHKGHQPSALNEPASEYEATSGPEGYNARIARLEGIIQHIQQLLNTLYPPGNG